LPELTDALLKSQVNAVAYETIREADGSLPLLTPMSEVAGRMAVQVGAVYLERPNGGRGILLGGIPGVAPANVVVIGGGVVGHNAAKMACGLGAHVTIIDRNLNRLRQLDDIYSNSILTLASNTYTIRDAVRNADLVIGSVLIPGASAPKLVRREMIASMKAGAVVVDVAIDQGGCFETSHATTHTDPVYYVDDVLHYCVSNMPAAVPHTSTFGLTNATVPYLLALADKGLEGACAQSKAVREGVNTFRGTLTYPGVAESQGRSWREISSLI
jgi:alanine dehydrogenase